MIEILFIILIIVALFFGIYINNYLILIILLCAVVVYKLIWRLSLISYIHRRIKLVMIIILIISVLVVCCFYLNKWYHTRISSFTPQSGVTVCSPEKPIKGNAQSGIYHMPNGQYYEQTMPEVCFSTEQEAKDAGYRRSKK